MITKTGQALQVKPFVSKPTLIPEFVSNEFTGKAYKAELNLMRSLEGGARLHVWFGPDRRPHNHPWRYIVCKVIHGGYTAIEYVPDGTGGYTERIVRLRAGDPEHRVEHETHHQVLEVEPGTVSTMCFGPVIADGKQWGNLVKDGDSFRYEPNSSPAGFLDAMRHLNPHMRPEGWVDPYAHIPVVDVNESIASVGL